MGSVAVYLEMWQ